MAFSTVKECLFNPDVPYQWGSEFDDGLIDERLDSFQISRSLSMKGCP